MRCDLITAVCRALWRLILTFQGRNMRFLRRAAKNRNQVWSIKAIYQHSRYWMRRLCEKPTFSFCETEPRARFAHNLRLFSGTRPGEQTPPLFRPDSVSPYYVLSNAWLTRDSAACEMQSGRSKVEQNFCYIFVLQRSTGDLQDNRCPNSCDYAQGRCSFICRKNGT